MFALRFDIISKIPCKHFNFGEGTCPFGSSCFYSHVRKDGTRDVVHLRKYMNGEEEVKIMGQVKSVFPYFFFFSLFTRSFFFISLLGSLISSTPSINTALEQGGVPCEQRTKNQSHCPFSKATPFHHFKSLKAKVQSGKPCVCVCCVCCVCLFVFDLQRR